MPALHLQPVHQQPPQPVRDIDLHQDGLAALWVHGLPHQLVAAHEADHLIGEVLGGLQEGVVRLTGALCGDTRGCMKASPSCSPPPCSPAPYRARSGIGDTALVFYPAVVKSFLVCKGTTEGSSHGCHGVDTDSRATEDTAAGGTWGCQCPCWSAGTGHMHTHVPETTLSPVTLRVTHSTQEVTGICLAQLVQPVGPLAVPMPNLVGLHW